MTIYLYVKTHNKTGLKYLGQTKQDPYSYKGSGVYWTKHLLEFGNDVSTLILHETVSKQKMQSLGRYYSKLWNIVDDNKWANLIPETGGGAGNNGTMSKSARAAQSKRMSGPDRYNLTNEYKQKVSGANHWMNQPKHAHKDHVMTRPDVRAKVSGKNSYRYNTIIYSFYNPTTNVLEHLTAYEFRMKYTLDQSSVSRLIHGKFKQCKGWYLA